MEIETLVCGPLGNNVYVVANAARAIVVDAPLESATPLLDLLRERNLQVDLIVLTHSHWDHVADAAQLAQATGASLAAHPLDAVDLARSRRSMLLPGVDLPPLAVGRELNDGDVLDLGGLQLRVLLTPGHTPGSICLYTAEQSTLLAGDTLFAGSYGRVDLPGGDPRQMAISLRRLAALPPATRVLPGHGPSTTIGAESWLVRVQPFAG